MNTFPKRITLAAIIVLTMSLVVGLSLYHDSQTKSVQDHTVTTEPVIAHNQKGESTPTESEDTLGRDHSFEMSSRNVRDLLERVDNQNPLFDDANRLDDNNRFYYIRGNQKRDDSLRDFLNQIGYGNLFDLKTVAGSRTFQESDCKIFDVLQKASNPQYVASVCNDGLESDKVTYSLDSLPYSLNLFQLDETHFYFNVKTLGVTGSTLVSKLYKRDTGQVIDIDPSVIGQDVYFKDKTLWFVQFSQIVFSYNTGTDQGVDRSKQTHNKSKKWWVDHVQNSLVVQSFDQTSVVNLGTLLKQQSDTIKTLTPELYFEVSGDLSKFALIGQNTCNDDWSDCFVTLLYGNFAEDGLQTAKSIEVPFGFIETSCAPDGDMVFFWDGNYIVTTSGCPIKLELTVLDTITGELLYQHGSVKENYISDILITPYRVKYGDQSGRATNTSFAQIPKLVNEFCIKHPWRDGSLQVKKRGSQQFITSQDLDRMLKNGMCFSPEAQDYLSYIMQDFCGQIENVSALAIEGYEIQSVAFTADLAEVCDKNNLQNTYAQECAVQSESEQDAINNFKRVCGNNTLYKCGSVDGRSLCASFPIISDSTRQRTSGWFEGLYPSDFCYVPKDTKQNRGWNFAKAETCLST